MDDQKKSKLEIKKEQLEKLKADNQQMKKAIRKSMDDQSTDNQ